MSALDSLANELRAHICSFHHHHDLTVLMRVNKSLRCLIEPMLYSRVELHSPGYHEHYRYPNEVDIMPNEHRNYCRERDPGDNDFHDSYAAERALSFMKLFEDSDESDGHPRARGKALAEHVRFLCFDFYFDETLVDPLGIFACFQNLGHLELVMKWPTNEIWDTAVRTFVAKSRAPLNNLRTLRLRGYVPKEFVQYLCQGTTGITDLELAVLGRPIASLDDASDIVEDFEYENAYSPRALAALFGAVDLAKQFPCLTRLRLCRPTESLNDCVYNDFVSVVSDIAILKEWAALIRATRGTLEHLILDQRPFAEDIEQDSSDHRSYLIDYVYGPGYDRFAEHTLPALLEDGADAEWPCLKSVHLHGFDGPPQDDLMPQRLLAIVSPRFEPLGVDVRSNLGSWMLYDSSDGVIQDGDGLGGGRWEE
ncbi:hypothetical protein MSAN_02244100 [Mycena sanguinolenta]|uniref:F-box domain-containing protein n=1 Tax=Mycena sanguinolenta TaxID=230812 RepID=A0A8H7CIN5_9AGAR|nr:hypothetical protein MSAN_02244100 [Mycena sanguinolenta]